MSTITTRAGKGSPLTNAELDANFSNLNTDKAEKSVTISAGTGLTGGGDLSANRTLALAASGVTAGSIGSSTAIPIITFDQYGRITGVSSSALDLSSKLNVSGGTMTGALSGTTATFSGLVTAGNAGFQSASYAVGARNRIWSFANADGYGISYLQGSAGKDGTDSINLSPNGDVTANGSAFSITGSGNAYATASFRAPIFYDSENTGFYLNPNGTSYVNTFTSSGDIKAGAALCYGIGGTTGAGAIYSDGNWGCIHWAKHPSPAIAQFRWASASDVDLMRIDTSGNLISNVSTRSPIFYDSNDTTYNLDPASTSTLNAANLYGAWYFRTNKGASVYLGASNSPSLQAYCTDNGSAFMSFHRGGQYAVNFGLDPDNLLRIGGWSAAANLWQMDMSGNNWLAGSSRAPIFYDSNNTGYYCDPNSTSNFAGLTLNGVDMATRSIQKRRYRIHPDDGTSMDTTLLGQLETGFNYGTSSGVTGPYLTFGGLGGSADYQAQINANYGDGSVWKVRVRNDDASTWGAWRNLLLEDVWINNKHFGSDGNIYSNASMRAPVFYDQNDTGYYVDPNGTSKLSTLQVGNISNNWNIFNGYSANGPGIGFENQSTFARMCFWDLDFYDWNAGSVLRLNSYAQSDTSFRAPIFYDSNDTGYYIDPNSTSDSALRMRGGAFFGPNPTWGAYLYVGTNGRPTGEAAVCVTNGNLHLDAKDGYDIYLNHYNGRAVRVPGILDDNDTAYYCDPNGTSNLAIVTANQLNVYTFTPIVDVNFNNSVTTGTFTLAKRCACLLIGSGSAYSGGGLMTLTMSIDGVGTISTVSWYTNEPSSHKSSPNTVGKVTLNAGTYTVRLTNSASSDTNDRGNVAIVAVPTN